MKNKNNYSAQHLKFLKVEKRKSLSIISLRILVLVIFLLLWELLTRFEVLDSFIFSSPSRVAVTIGNLYTEGTLFYHMGITLSETVTGFILSTVIGTLIAIVLWWSVFTRKVLEPYIVVINSLPKIALGPIIIIWFGIGFTSILVMAILISVVITIINMQTAFLKVDSDKILLLKSMGATKFQILYKLMLPATLPDFISVLKINIGLAWVGTIMGEYLSSSAGLGYLIVFGGQVFKLDLVMASTIILCALSVLMYGIIVLVEKVILKKWRK
ncbi:MAG: ABC transporter permease [Firmicutes bacterium]|nr:ABC transporter permease [Bacillota bacterium]